MKVKYIGEYYKVRFIKEKIYDAEKDPESSWFQITDETGDTGLVPADEFQVIEK